MGIQGLLPILKSIVTPVHVQIYAGKKAAVDTYSWLHKAAYTCSKDLCEGRPNDKFIDYCMLRVNLLRHYGVQPLLVFDGGVLPMKADQEAKRARLRKEHLERAQEHERLGNHSAAYECYQRAVDITPAMAARLIKVLKQEGVQYVVAPYEADAQMAYLAVHGLVDVVITEDSDLIAYGCPRVLFKMSKSGQGDEFQYSDLVRNKDTNFANFTEQMVLEMCIMTGCDYLPSLPGMGVKKAHRLMRRFKSYQKVFRHLRFSGTTVSAEYEELFGKALLTFRHQRVYDPVRQEMVHLSDVPNDLTVDLEFVGPDLPQKLVKAIAEGEVDPSTNLPFQQDTFAPVVPPVPKFGVKNLMHQFVERKPLELLVQKNVLTNYFFSESQEAKKQFKPPRTLSCTEQQIKNLPPKGTLGSRASGSQNLVNFLDLYPNAADVFGSPLPDDDEDKAAEVNEEALINMLVLRSQYTSSRRAGVLQDALKSPVQQVSSSESTTTTGRLSVKERKKNIVDVPQVKLSGYFSHSQLECSKSVNAHTTDIPTVRTETNFQDADSCNREVVKKSRVESHKNVEAGSSRLGLQSQDCFEDVSHSMRQSAECRVIDNRNQLSSLRTVLKEGGTSEVATFSSNVSHVDNFAHIAQQSVDRFVQSIAPFRCSKGARASGLRPPMSKISTITSTRATEKSLSTLEASLIKFSYQPSSFKPPSLSLNYSRPSLVTTAAVRSQETNSKNWSQ